LRLRFPTAAGECFLLCATIDENLTTNQSFLFVHNAALLSLFLFLNMVDDKTKAQFYHWQGADMVGECTQTNSIGSSRQVHKGIDLLRVRWNSMAHQQVCGPPPP
jgi:hypothetical protein